MFCSKIDARTELRLIERQQSGELFRLLEANRQDWRQWHPWMDFLRTPAEVEKTVGNWLLHYANNRGYYAGIWYDGRLCGVIHHVNVDWMNHSTVLAYWLDAGHQGKGIMTACCRAVIAHSFDVWKLHRVTIQCATDNARSRAIPERLGFKFEGVIRGIEWLHDRHADHAMYSLLRTDPQTWRTPAAKVTEAEKPEAVVEPMEMSLAEPVLAPNAS
jgi:ribosomal-protein-serine acetyltransferase